MRRCKTVRESIAAFQNLWIGDSFTDHAGRRVLKISETEISTGAGYNNVLPIGAYIAAIRERQEFAGYVVPGFDRAAFMEFSYA